MLGMMVDAARVDWAYVEGAYPGVYPLYEDCESTEIADTDMLGLCPLRKGKLGRWRGGCLSMPKDELRRDFSSKWPDFFSLKVCAKPESLRDTGVVGIGGKFIETGEMEDCGLVLPDLLVVGRSLL